MLPHILNYRVIMVKGRYRSMEKCMPTLYELLWGNAYFEQLSFNGPQSPNMGESKQAVKLKSVWGLKLKSVWGLDELVMSPQSWGQPDHSKT